MAASLSKPALPYSVKVRKSVAGRRSQTFLRSTPSAPITSSILPPVPTTNPLASAMTFSLTVRARSVPSSSFQGRRPLASMRLAAFMVGERFFPASSRIACNPSSSLLLMANFVCSSYPFRAATLSTPSVFLRNDWRYRPLGVSAKFVPANSSASRLAVSIWISGDALLTASISVKALSASRVVYCRLAGASTGAPVTAGTPSPARGAAAPGCGVLAAAAAASRCAFAAIAAPPPSAARPAPEIGGPEGSTAAPGWGWTKG